MAQGSNKIMLEIVTPYGAVYAGEVDEVVAQGTEGEFGVMPGHAHMVTTIKPGLLTAGTLGAKPAYFFVGSGYAEVGPDKVVVMADSAEKSEDIDVERAMNARKKAEEELRRQETEGFVSAESALERAIARVHVAEHTGTGMK